MSPPPVLSEDLVVDKKRKSLLLRVPLLKELQPVKSLFE
jgi:hypothetical protein